MINTNQPVSKTEAQIYKKFKNLSINEEPLPQGDGSIRISPFDDYFIFTFFDESNGENVPIDLSNVGTLMMSFIGKNDEIRIPYYTNVSDVDLSQGQVLFRISKDDSKKILNLDNNNFYISTKMVSNDGSESDESVIYTGTFQSITDDARVSLTSQIDDLRIQYTKDVAILTNENTTLKKQVNDLTTQLNQANLIIQNLRNSNESLTNDLFELSKDLTSQKIEKTLNDAKQAQAVADKNQNEVTQKNAINSRITDKTNKITNKIGASKLQKFR